MAKVKQVGDTGTESPVVEETPIETEIKATTVETVATEDQTLETETEDEDVAYVAKRPLLHGGEVYKAGEDVTRLFSKDEADRLLKMGVIEEA